ncbi:hypothetical protein BZZ01_09850 [Nostocales cyanobacterium HT-58-2]|nr:hypothetical protein BZZ01_09850 [Nostocales cyanobacterium HT-58-2]
MQSNLQQYQCVHEIFETQVLERPDTIALICENKQLTYFELNYKANQLAHYLQKLGVQPECPVGICVERSLDMVVGMLGVLKAGGVYVPLDPKYSLERLDFIIEDVQAPIILSQEHLVETIPTLWTRIICLDSDWEIIANESGDNPCSKITPENLAYIIYTSGTTGKPKGTEVPHRSIIGFMFGVDYIHLNSEQTFLQHSSISWDALTLELWIPLLYGGCCVLFPGRSPLPSELSCLIKQHRISVLWLASALFNSIIDSMPEALFGIQQLIVGGEALSVAHIQRALKILPVTKIINGYGPSECTVFTCCYSIPKLLGKDIKSIPIGKPIGDRKVYLLNSHLKRVSVGIPGEIYVGGWGVGRGYLNRQQLTAEKFIPNPFSKEPGARLYKTGDLARYLPDGNIEFLGRLDEQVKIRGFRVELKEIEMVLSQHPAVRETVVMAREDVPSNKQILAYVVPDPTLAPTPSQLRSFLKEKLPDYMVPAAIMLLKALPLTSNGKVDRYALPVPDTTRPELSQEYIASKTPIEELLASIWSNILGLQQIGIHDDFFELGGHSLLATQLLSQIRNIFGVELQLHSIFEEPTIAKIAEHIQRAGQKQALLPDIISPIDRNQELPLSFAQQRLWFLDQLQPASPFYNIPFAIHLQGILDIDALQRSFNQIIRRHEVLRTNFVKVDGQPKQIIANSLTLHLPIVDLGEVPAHQRYQEVESLTVAQAMQSFSLAEGLLLRATLLQLEATEYVLLLTMHHIVSDGWSMGVLIRELKTLYTAFVNGQAFTLPELSIQYADFAYWQRQWLQGKVLQTQLSYWQKQLAGIPPVLNLPINKARPIIQTFHGETKSFSLSTRLTEELKAFSQRSKVTLFMTLLAAFQVLLYRYSGQDDICVGSPIANRHHSQTEQLIGFFVNTLVLRTRLTGNCSFLELLTQVREVALNAYTHQDLPFEQLVETLQPQRHLSHQPIFQVMFALQNAPMPVLDLPNLTVSFLGSDLKTAKFDLSLLMEENDYELVGVWEYNSNLFNEATITNMASHFQILLEAIVANPEQRIAALPLLTQPEQQQLLEEWNNTQASYSEDICIHQLFEAQVELTPDAVAVVFEDQQLTYRELNDRANQLAHYLQKLGVGSEIFVGVCLERSLEMLIGLMGVLKAGAAYVPLDPKYPQERLAFMLQDSQVLILLSQQNLNGKLSALQALTVNLDTDWETVTTFSKANPTSKVTSSNLAYVIYTSGSTGRPKGVAIAHNSTVALLDWARGIYSVEDITGVFASTSICFDLSVFELFVPLSWGGQVILAENLLHLPSLNGANKVTLMNTVPSAITELQRSGSLPTSVHIINLAGEPLQNLLVQQLYQQKTIQQVFNLYGPSEDTTYSTFVLTKEGTSESPTIGRPINNTQVYILDSYLQPVPVGVTGELYISGSGLARGYFNLPELTAEKFIPHPFSKQSGARLYKTGDLVSYQADGNIKYHGRLDHQVKIRGFRIELDEIETVLSQHPSVREAIVLVREDLSNDKRLVAYLVANQEIAFSTTEIRDFLRNQLPEYMVPSVFVQVDAFPLTPTGKVDRLVLQAPDNLRPDLEVAYVEPSTELEQALAQLWQETLQLEKVGIHDNFFDLGGHSLLLLQVHSKLCRQFERDITVLEMFQYPTIKSLVNHLSQGKNQLQQSDKQIEKLKEGRDRLKQRFTRTQKV